jgi:predicted RNA-binding Zn-ribbon protein involved in translation (DUF1610 family)
MVMTMTKAFKIYCRRCKCEVRPIKSMVMFHCPKCGTEFLPSQIKEAKNAKADTILTDDTHVK